MGSQVFNLGLFFCLKTSHVLLIPNISLFMLEKLKLIFPISESKSETRPDVSNRKHVTSFKIEKTLKLKALGILGYFISPLCRICFFKMIASIRTPQVGPDLYLEKDIFFVEIT